MISNLFWCVVGALLSLIISFIFYRKSQNRKCLTYGIKTTCIISSDIKNVYGLEVNHNSEKIENLYRSLILIKNTGNSIVEKQDLAPSYPISISTSGKFINAETCTVCSAPQDKKINPSLSLKETDGICNYIEITFDYIPKKGLILYSLYHTENIVFNGDLMDGKIIPLKPYRIQRQSLLRSLMILLFVLQNIVLTIYWFWTFWN